MYTYKYVCLCECLLPVWGYLLRPEDGVDLLELVLQAVVSSFVDEGHYVLITTKRFLLLWTV